MNEKSDVDAPASVGGTVVRWLVVTGLALLGLGLVLAAVDDGTPDGLKHTDATAGIVLLVAAAGLALPVWSAGMRRLGLGFGVALLLLTLLLIPDLVPARISTNERVAIRDLRALVSAQEAYAKANAGFSDGRLSCLERPGECIPDYRGDPAAFIEPELALPTRRGYARAFHAGRAASPLPSAASRSSVRTFAITAAPLQPMHSGVRGFCADSAGKLCFTTDGTAPPVQTDGTCDLQRCIEVDKRTQRLRKTLESENGREGEPKGQRGEANP